MKDWAVKEVLHQTTADVVFKPLLRRLLRQLGLDITFHRGAGCQLYYFDATGKEVEILDLVGGYGTLLLGHGHPALVSEAQRLLSSGRPMHVQASRREYAEALARQLSTRAGGNFRAVFANSGAEAVEAALKHAVLERGSRTFIALEGAFHGKTLGALQLMSNPIARQPFELTGLKVLRVRPNDLVQLDSVFEASGDVAGFVFEPIQGEGGVRLLERRFVERAAEHCRRNGAALIADECQTGVGRTGAFLACQWLGVRPDYIILSKALSGGLAKISATLIDARRYREDFDLLHTSTYADDDFSCAIALKTLEILDDRMLERCRCAGHQLQARLTALQARYPNIIREVRGAGLMLGLEFWPRQDAQSLLLRYFSTEKQLGTLIASYLFRGHRVRVAPTLSDPLTLRVQPSVQITSSQMDHFCEAVDDVCQRLDNDDAVALTRHLKGPQEFAVASSGPLGRSERQHPMAYNWSNFSDWHGRRPSVPVAWLCHLVTSSDLRFFEPALADVATHHCDALVERLATLLKPIVMNISEIRSRTGACATFYPILLPVTSRWIKTRMDRHDLRSVQRIIELGIDVARDLGCRTISLGQFTSSATRSGRRLNRQEVGLTTGNSLTAALATQAIDRALKQRGLEIEDCRLAVVGAAGNIGRICAILLGQRCRRVLLIGNRSGASRNRIARVARDLPHATTTTDLNALLRANVVIAAVNAVDAPLQASHLASQTILCDVSVPAAIAPEVSAARPDVTVLSGGLVQLPHGEDLEIVGFPLPAGKIYGCMAEGLLLGMEGIRDRSFTGRLRVENVRLVEALAAKHGMTLADDATALPVDRFSEELAAYVNAD